MDHKKAGSKAAVLAACLELEGVRELTCRNLSEATGYGLDTCREHRDALHAEGLIRKGWRDYSGRGYRAVDCYSEKDDALIKARTAIVRDAKIRLAVDSLDPRTLARVLPA